MAQKILIMGESGTGKSTSMRNFNPDELVVINPVNKPLPFKGKFEMLNAVTESDKIVSFMKKAVKNGKKIIVVDDFQYILSIPYMNRIKEAGWDKWNDFGSNYFEIIDVCAELPDDVTVYYLTHTETLENGVTTIKLIGKLLREKITIEGLFTIVLRTQVIDGKYYFLTQNSGKDTVKSPMGMFPAYAIDNDLKYVDEKIRNYYEIGDFKSDAEMVSADEAVKSDIAKPDSNGRRARGTATAPRTERKSRSQVEAENAEKIADYMQKCDEAVDKIADGREEVPFDEASAAVDSVPKPDLEKPPRRTRGERKAEQNGDFQDNTDSRTVTLDKDSYFFVPATNNYIMKHKGDTVDLVVGGVAVLVEITKEEFVEGGKKIAQEGSMNIPDGCDEEPIPMNPPEEAPKSRQRKSRTVTPPATEPVQEEAPQAEQTNTGRRRRTR